MRVLPNLYLLYTYLIWIYDTLLRSANKLLFINDLTQRRFCFRSPRSELQDLFLLRMLSCSEAPASIHRPRSVGGHQVDHSLNVTETMTSWTILNTLRSHLSDILQGKRAATLQDWRIYFFRQWIRMALPCSQPCRSSCWHWTGCTPIPNGVCWSLACPFS